MKALAENRPVNKMSRIYLFIARYLFSVFAVCSAAFILLKFSAYSASGVKKGIDICMNSLIPSLYPFMILTNYYALSELSDFNVRLINKLCSVLFRLPGCSAAVILFSFVGGLPVGAKMSAGLYERGLISKEQCRRMMCFCVNPGPAFVISAVGMNMLGSEATGVIIYVSLILSSVAMGIASRFFTTENESYINYAYIENREDYGSPLEKAVIRSSKSIFSICAWVVAFSCLNEITANLNINESLRLFILCTSEMTNGCLKASESFSAPIVAAVIGFSGFCGHLQLIGEINKVKLKYKYFLVGRIINSGLCAVICGFLLKCFPVAEETFSVGVKPEVSENSGSLVLSVLMLLMAFLFLIGDDYRLERKNTKKV